MQLDSGALAGKEPAIFQVQRPGLSEFAWRVKSGDYGSLGKVGSAVQASLASGVFKALQKGAIGWSVNQNGQLILQVCSPDNEVNSYISPVAVTEEDLVSGFTWLHPTIRPTSGSVTLSMVGLSVVKNI